MTAPQSEYEQRVRAAVSELSYRDHSIHSERGSDGREYFIVVQHRARGRAGFLTRLGARAEVDTCLDRERIAHCDVAQRLEDAQYRLKTRDWTVLGPRSAQ